MIEKMTKYSFVLLNGEQELFLQKLQTLGVVDVTRSTKPIDETSSSLLAKAQELKSAVDVLEKTSFEGITAQEVKSDDPSSLTFELVNRLKEAGLKEKDIEKEIKERRAWGEFDQEKLEGLDKLGYKIRYYHVPKKKFNTDWEQSVALQIVCDDDKNVYFVTVSNELDYSFPIKECEAPEADVKEAENRLSVIRNEIEDIKAKLLGLKDQIDRISSDYHEAMECLDMYLADISSEKAVESYIILIEGFAPHSEEERLSGVFEEMDVIWFKEDAKVEDNPPIKLNSNKFTELFAPLTDMYGRPEYNGFDPTPYISVFFLLFFAFCMGDAGYGLVIMLAGMMMKKSEGFKSMAGLVSVLGAGTIVIGLFFHTFFSMDMLTWSCLPEAVKSCMLPGSIAGYNGTMVMAIIVGVIHLCVAMVVKAINLTSQKGFVKNIGTWGWTLLLVGGVIVGSIALTGVLNEALTKWILIVLGIVSAAGIYLFNDIHRNPLINIGAGLWDTYNTATGLLGDVLSYLRLYALGLGGSMLGQAFNTMGTMAKGDGGAGGWIGFILIVLVGHVLNIAIAALGAFVHPLRLNFLEFFKNSGYQTSARNYSPLYNKELKQNK